MRTDPGGALGDTPQQPAVVEAARRRKALLELYIQEWGVRNIRRLRTPRERDPILKARQRMDLAMSTFIDPKTYEEVERGHLAALNQRPLRLDVTDDAVRFHVRFQVRFEGLTDREASSRFATVRNSLTTGIQTVWNQKLQGEAFAGRSFELVPEIELVSAKAARNLDDWLVTVRPTDTGPLEYEGQSLGEAPAGLPTSVTDPTVDGGVMSIPPRHATQPDTLGHETLHLFGLVDRYVSIAEQPKGGGKVVNRNLPLRKTGGRPDPLATEHEPILREDLAYLFEHLGVYQMEESRALDTLRALEAHGMDYAMATVELHRQEEIIRLGQDPGSLIEERRSFINKMIESVDEL